MHTWKTITRFLFQSIVQKSANSKLYTLY